ncbi:receptor-type tyrosine-protein phosphatase F-like [Dendronephthya gigantea]|uniref:receptor-type tyrosine-protein phosphatase F-like n=1 Tax=Dendronephthya gigantea TaxID=151771 RepID=UPI0010699554|nr:receptor-type tyrosine-protein phosphatase F-like [Dendronephthya gigantea]
MRTRFWQNVHALVLICVWMSWCSCKEEILCRWKRLTCSSPKTIRVHDVIYGHVVGRNECNTHPQTNCTAPDGFCAVGEKIEGKSWPGGLNPSTTIRPPPCGGSGIYIIVNYSCKEKTTLSGENFALERPTSQSKTEEGGSASRAVDGKAWKNYNSRSCTHTGEDANPWWRVELQQRILVANVKITNRNYHGERLCGFEIRIGDSLRNNGTTNTRCGAQQYIPKNMDGIVSCEPAGVVGRYVTILIPGDRKILTLCEVEVYGTGILGNQNRTKLQLDGSNHPYEGRIVEKGATFCDSKWSFNDANVACVQLGYIGADARHWNNSYFGESDSSSFEKTHNCLGTEGSLMECPRIIDSKKTCEKQNAVSVTCQPYIRLRGSNIPLMGRVEVFHRGIWGTICGYDEGYFRDADARVACRELGFYDVVEHGIWKYPVATGKVWLRFVFCQNDSKSLVFCSHDNWGNTGCSHHWDVYIKCSICRNSLLQDVASFPNSVFNASAAVYPDFGPSSARLYNTHPWCLPESNTDKNQYLEINLPGIFSLSAVATVGGTNLGYVTSYMLSYRVNGYSWKYATVGTQEIIYGNTNDETHNVIRRDLDTAIHAERVRFIPKTWQRAPCMRVELCGQELPRCNPANITAESITSNSVWISWLWLRLPKNNTLHNNYSLTVKTEDRKTQYFNSTELTSVFVPNLSPYRQYFYTVKAIGLTDCFDGNLEFMFRTKQAAPSGPPTGIHVKHLNSTSVRISWLRPEANQQNGIISSYQLCYSDKNLQNNCSAMGNVSHINTGEISATLQQLEPGVVYYFRIRANTTAGAGPYSKEYRMITSSGDFHQSEDVNTTANSFAVQFQQPKRDFRYVQIIVMQLEDNHLPKHPRNYTPDKILMLNETAPILKPYVTAEMSVGQVHELKTFVIGDGMNYGRLTKKRRRKAEIFAKRYDENGEQELGDKRTSRSLKATLFYNRPLVPDAFYSAFQRTYINEDTYYSSSWCEPVRTNTKDNENAERMDTSTPGSGALIGIGVGVAVIFIILLILLILFLLKRKKKKMEKTNSRVKIIERNQSIGNLQGEVEYENYNDSNQYMAMDDLDAGDRDTDSETDAAGDNPVNYDNTDTLYGNAKVTETRDPFRMVPAEEFQSYVQDLKKNDNFGFDNQFKELPQGISYPCTIAKSPENKSKNRYGNIVSYDDALVTLTDNGQVSYINASFITGVKPRSYIATQGPTTKTVSTFWEMIWEQECSIIVMLTNLKEKEKVKCAKYWTESSKAFGKIFLTFQGKELFPYYVIRKFLLEKDESERYVTQFHFTAWPDHGVPKYPTQLLAFQHALRSPGVEINGPIVVHCSAGVGRTGTFIAIDHSLENFFHQDQRSVDVFHIVQEMRKCRVNMIQTLEQYILVHEAILEFILFGFNELEGNALEHAIQQLKKTNPSTKQTGFAEIFQRLRSFSPVLTKQECKTATLDRNSCKNRTKEICPADFARVTLSSSISSSDYINATFVDGFQQKNAYIATDCPLANTFDDFWQMIYEQRSPLVVMLNNWKEGREKYTEYFPTEEGYTTKYGNFYVRLDEQVSDKAIIFRKFSISMSSNFESPNVVRHFQYTQWPKRTVPDKPDDILQLIHTIQTAQRKNTQGPMVVHCGNGAGRTGTFVTISICMERLKIEQRVDVFQCIKLIREHRPQFVENELQLQFCYEVLAKFIESFEGYSNFLATD